MNRVVSTAAAAAAVSAFFAAAAAPQARAQLVYESFDFPAGGSLDGKINPIDAQPWAKMSNNESDDEILLSSGSLSYPALSPPLGNSVSYDGSGKSQRLGFDRTVRDGQLYYALVLRVSSLGTMTGSPVFIAGFSDRAGESGLPPTTVGTRLYLRQGATSSPGAETFNLGVSKNSGFDITFDTTEYALNVPLLVVGSYQVVGAGSGTDDVARLYINPTSLGSAAAPTVSTVSSPIITAPVAGTDLTVAGVPSLAGFVLRQGSDVPQVQVDELRIDSAWARVTPPTGVSWSADAGGAWSDETRWSTLAAPNAADAFVNFNNVISQPRVIDLDVPVALRALNLDATQPYTFSGTGGGSLAFSASAGVNVRRGSHAIAAPVSLGGEMLISVASGAAATFSGDFAGGAHAVIKAGDGALTLKHLRAGRLEVIGGTLTIASDGGAAGTSRATAVAIEHGAALDLADNDMVVDYSDALNSPLGTFDGSGYSGVAGLIASGRNGGSWDGSGIRTTRPQALSGITTLGVGEAADLLHLNAGQTALWSGQVVDDTSVLVRYTYGGDANLDGLISGDDYTAIDFSIATPGASGWANGDFNYDGFISGDDYTVIDFNIAAQGASRGAAAGVNTTSAVPEPATALWVGLAAAWVAASRRGGRCRRGWRMALNR